MAWPKKGTHSIVVDGEQYLWRIRDWLAHSWITIKKAGVDGQLLMVDPRHHDLPFGPKPAQMAISWAKDKGWSPDKKGSPMKLRYNGDQYSGEPFTILPVDWTWEKVTGQADL